MNAETSFISATPVLASLDIERSVAFFCTHLGFTAVHVQQGVYGVAVHGKVGLHFWACEDRRIAEATSCRFQVAGVAALHARCAALGIVHPNAPLQDKPWGATEFSVLDPDGNLVTFSEPGRAAQ